MLTSKFHILCPITPTSMQKEEEEKEEEKNMTIFTKMTWGITNDYNQLLI